MKVRDIVSFSKDNFYNGAVQTEWYYDAKKRKSIAESYVFHGPKYYGVSHNSAKIGAFLHFVQRYLYKVLNRRSHKRSYTWDGYIEMLKVYPLAKPKIYVKLF